MIEVASGKALDVFLDEEIFTPLGMNDTQLFPPQELAGRLTKVYRGKAGGGIEPAPAVASMQGQGEYLDGPKSDLFRRRRL